MAQSFRLGVAVAMALLLRDSYVATVAFSLGTPKSTFDWGSRSRCPKVSGEDGNLRSPQTLLANHGSQSGG